MKFGASKSVLGLDVGSRTTKIAQLAFSAGKAKLAKCAVAETGIDDEGFVGHLRSFLSEQKVRGMTVAVCFDDPSLIIRKMELPKMPDPDFAEALRWSLRDLIEGDPAEYAVTHSLIKENESGTDSAMLQIVAYAAKREAVHIFKTKIEQAGLSPAWIEPESVTLASTLDRCETSDNEYLAGVDIGYGRTLFYVVGKRLFLFSRPIKGVDFVAYEKDPQDFPQKLAIEVQKSIDTFQVNFEMQTLGRLYLSGEGALVEGIDNYLETNLGIKTHLLNSFKSLAENQDFASLRPELFAKAIGLAYTQI